MRSSRRVDPQLDLDELPAEIRAKLEETIIGAALKLMHSGQEIGVLEFRSLVLAGTIVDSSAEEPEQDPVPDGVKVIATAIPLASAARRRLSDEFGENYIVLDLSKAPASSEVLLIHPVSPQLLGILRQQFPQARVIITEIDDEELGVNYSGPVGRLLEAGADAYLPPQSITEVAAQVHAYLSRQERATLESAKPSQQELPQ
ncbi:hypothetical protein [Psychromicrobium lacuslunae]|uniref:hypothetical protein n=1 Tax=Psychromicrobium lacuslunae TaxID=1618207 RepID=UPI0005D3E59D|nr:hypothetical protein [Psychromicrobium lacuslunae]